jgi:RecB family exonuclease
VRDPYAIYARKVLRLKPLDRPGRAADALARGSALHAALEAFVAATADGLPANAEAVFADTTARILDEMAPWPAIRSIWAARLARAASWFLEGEAERRERGIPLAREVRGRRALGGTPVRFEVSARADRIDRTPGGYAIYDYKSGNVPSEREAAAFHLQLPLEAAIAAAGGFEGLAAAPATHLELIGVGARKSLSVSASPDDIALTWQRLEKLIGYYLDPASAFVARLRPQRITYASDYDQLSRKGEWADGDPPETGP